MNFLSCFVAPNEQAPLSLSMLGLQDERGNWYLCQIGEKWNQESSTWESVQRQPVILLSKPLPITALRYEPDRGTQFQLQRALFATFDPALPPQVPHRVTVHNHFNINMCTIEENQWRDELRLCAEALLDLPREEVASMRADVHELRDLVQIFVDEYKNKNRILELGRRTHPAYFGSDFDLDIQIECGADLTALDQL